MASSTNAGLETVMVCIASGYCVIWYLTYGGPQESIKGVRHRKTSLEYAPDISEVIDGSNSNDDDFNTFTEEYK